MIQIKLNLLLDKLIITTEVYHYCQELIACMLEQEHISHEDEASSFVMHLAMAVMRSIKNDGELVAKLDSDLQTQLTCDAQYDRAVELWQQLALGSPCPLHPNEDAYLYMHLITLLNK